ncbi:MAG: S9 family peptidase [Rikenellaceae bacterium]|nr:S9 family peptidase [Rikenellaceae bacterium]
MKRLKLFSLMALSAFTLGSCAGSADAPVVTDADIVPTLTPAEIEAGVMTPEVMWKMGRIGSHSLSPDGSTLLYTITYYNMADNKGTTAIFTQPAEGGQRTRLTANTQSASSPAWSADGSRIYYATADAEGNTQVWSMAADGRDKQQITSVEGGIESFGVAPTGEALFYTAKVHVKDIRSERLHTDMDKSKAKIYDDLMVRHWDYWDEGDYSHIFVAEIENGKAAEGKDIMEGEPWDAPLAPYFDAAEIAWNNAGTTLAYTCKRQTGKEYAVSTDSDIFLYNIADGTTTNICEGKGLVGYDKYPVWSPDDTRIAFRSMRRAGNESDKERLMVYYLESGNIREITYAFDYNAEDVLWEDNNTLLFISPIHATHQVCRADIAGNVEVITSGDHDLHGLTVAAGKAVVSKQTHQQAVELCSVSLTDGALAQVTDVNAAIYDNIRMGQTEKHWVRTSDGKEMLTWVILPPDFDPNKKYPTLLYCQGGPQSVVSQFWSYRWNFQLMAAQGYIVVAPNRRGLPSFGQEWLDQISGDYSGQNIRDLLAAIDYVSAKPWSDEERLGCVGASYGGYSTFFLAGNHQKRFKALIAHCGIFNFESMYGHTEELWFVNNDYKGAYWDKANATAQRSYANSPHKFVKNWDTPILIFTGEKDYRIPYTQSLEAFTAAQLMGVPSRLVSFENEAHQVFKPQNSVVWNREFFGWLNKYLK